MEYKLMLCRGCASFWLALVPQWLVLKIISEDFDCWRETSGMKLGH